MRACLRHDPDCRPRFSQVIEVLRDLKGEVAVGHYVAADESIHVRHPIPRAFPEEDSVTPETLFLTEYKFKICAVHLLRAH